MSRYTSDEPSRPLLQRDFPENKAPRDWSKGFSPEIHMDQWLPNLSESSGPHRHRSIDCSSLSGYLSVDEVFSGFVLLFQFAAGRRSRNCCLPLLSL